MKAIRKALDRLRELDEPLWDHEASVWVDGNGDLHLKGPAGPETLAGQTLVADAIDLIAPFSTREGLRGPDLVRPRPELRIVPGRLSGSPHVVHTRLETRTLYALSRDGLDGPEVPARAAALPDGLCCRRAWGRRLTFVARRAVRAKAGDSAGDGSNGDPRPR